MRTRRTRRNADLTREALLSAATESFARHGFDGATVEMIARRARVNRAMISYYFGGKQGLYDAILAATFKPAGERLREIRDASLPPEARLRRFIEVFVETGGRHPHLPAMILREVLAGGLHLKDVFFDYVMTILSLIREILEQGVREGTFRPVDPLLTHLSLVGSLVFFLATGSTRGRWVANGRVPILNPAAEEYVRHVQELVIRGLAADPSRRRTHKETR